MDIRSIVSQDEGAYLAREYARIAVDHPPLRRFLGEIVAGLRALGVSPHDSVLDVGCGRGYLLHALAGQGFTSLRGLDPCDALVRDRVSQAVGPGAFFVASVPEKAQDVVIACHTLHHLPDPEPVRELAWMGRMARRLVVIVEINNTNLPMALMSLAHHRVEANAWRYNRTKVATLCRRAGLQPIVSQDMRAGYISGDTVLHRLAAHVGTRPYCLVAARP